MKTDVQIGQGSKMIHINDVAASIGIDSEDLIHYGKYKAKVSLDLFEKNKDKKDGKLILVTAINPTPGGEGKTTLNIGLSIGLNKLGKKSITTLREPSLGPSFGIKGGAAGGGYSQVVPMEDINLHFTGDFHAITSAHNLISALIDNHIHHGNKLSIDPNRVVWKRVLDMNDRALRNIIVGLGDKNNGLPREDSFDITVASEIMAIFCLAKDLKDLKTRVGDIIVAYNLNKEPITAKDLKAEGAVALIMKDAMAPNLVQTLENTPALIHGGPFANIAHGCNSLIATKMALKLTDYTITEAGFGADLGAEKFFNITARVGNLKPDAAVLVATIRALKYNGGLSKHKLENEDLPALARGFENLKKHIENMQKFQVPVIVAINKFATDSQAEINYLLETLEKLNVKAVLSDVWASGGAGGIELAKVVVDVCENVPSNYKPLYKVEETIKNKISVIAKEIYGADGVNYSKKALKEIKTLEKLGYDQLPICMAKTQYSLSDDPSLLGRPTNFNITVREIRISKGAGFIVVLTGQVMTMPGLPKNPAANNMDILESGEIIGLF